MDPIQTEQVLDEQGYTFLTFSELKGIGLHGLMKELERMKIADADVLTAPPVALAGVLFAAQYHDPQIVLNLEQYLRNRELRIQDRTLKGSADNIRGSGKPRQKSSVFGSVAMVHKIANENRDKDRKTVIKMCVEAGINENTAKTQYAKWLKEPRTT